MNEQPLDLRRVWTAIDRGRIAVYACVIAALVMAVVFTVAGPPDYSAKALILLPASSLDSNGEPSRDIATEIHIASSADVLSTAARALRPAPKVAQLTKKVHVSAPTPDILQVTAKAGSRGRAIETANRVADSYVAYSIRGASDLLNQVVSRLQRQAKSLSRQASDLEVKINDTSTKLDSMTPGSPEAFAQAGLLDTLRAQQANAASQLDKVQNQINDVQLNDAVANSGTRILERATTASSHALLVAFRNFAIALVLGLLLGTMTAVFRDRRDRRLRRRDDIASAAGVPAVASITATVAHSPDDWLTLLSGYEPSVDESWGLRRTLRHLVTSQSIAPARVTIVCLAGDDDAVGVAPQLAAFSAAAGVRTALFVDGSALSASSLREWASATDDDPKAFISNLWLFDARGTESADSIAPQLVVRMLVAETGRLEPPSPERDTTSLLAVSAGFATSEAITTVALAATEVGRPLFGVVVANPPTDDDSSGRLPQPLQPSRPRLPARITGIARGSG
jgi:capsular polysaccharide biosynthesis protein